MAQVVARKINTYSEDILIYTSIVKSRSPNMRTCVWLNSSVDWLMVKSAKTRKMKGIAAFRTGPASINATVGGATTTNHAIVRRLSLILGGCSSEALSVEL
jgi:hypothetical protein